MPLDNMYVGGVGKLEVATILSCEDFNAITTKGSVVVTEKHWVTDVLLALILEQDYVNALIDPGHEA